MRSAVYALTLGAALAGGHTVAGTQCRPDGVNPRTCAVAPGLELEVTGGRVPATTTALRSAVAWTRQQPGVESSELVVSAPNEGRSTRLVLVRLDPALVHLDLVTQLRDDYRAGSWTIDAASDSAVAALNAGQFTGIAPWGWSVSRGLEIRAPGVGPLSMAVVTDTSGRMQFVEPEEIEAIRAGGGIRTALQSYPTLLQGSAEIPEPLVVAGLGVDVPHRDARLAMGQLADGRVIILLTRFDGLGGAASGIPFGLTLRETAALLRAFGTVKAVALDGGISAQMLVRDSAGSAKRWRGWRKVPAGLEFLPR